MNKPVIDSIVRELLRTDERTRNDDRLLWLLTLWHYDQSAFGQSQDGIRYIFVDRLLSDLPMENTVKRVRAFIQNEEGLYKPTDQKVLEKRSASKRDGETFNKWRNGLI